MTPKYAGIDVSQWQGDIDFKAVKAGKIKEIPISFVMIRISVDKSIDKNAVKNINEALDSGLDVGVYHYSYAKTPEDAKAEAELALRAIKENGFDGKLTLPVSIDIENNEILKLGKDKCTAIAKAFMDTIAEADYQPAFYTYAAAYNAYFDKNAVKDYPLWIAGYIPEKTLNNTYGIKDYSMWQFGVAGNPEYDIEVIGNIPGVKGQCDCDYMYVDFPEKIKSEGKNGFTGKPPQKLYTLTIENITSKEFAEELLAKAEDEGYTGFITEETPSEPENPIELEVGDKVKMQEGAPIYGTTETFADWVYSSTLYVREIDGDRIVVSVLKTGDITGAVDRKYLTKI